MWKACWSSVLDKKGGQNDYVKDSVDLYALLVRRRGCSSYHACLYPPAPASVLPLVLAGVACDASLPLTLVLDHLSLPRAANLHAAAYQEAPVGPSLTCRSGYPGYGYSAIGGAASALTKSTKPCQLAMYE